MNIYEIIKRPIVTEKATIAQARNGYAFEVARKATKHEIKVAVEKAFKVKVEQVNVLNVPGKTKRMGKRMVKGSPWKKAFVTLEPGNKIQLFEGV
jgi:large subunit ribosomal protein L23